MTTRRRLVRVPASSANLGPGFDVLAAALTVHLELEVTEGSGFAVDPGGADVPEDRSNLCVRAFEALHPAYVSALLSGLRDAGKDETFDWRPVLRLCEWVIGRSAEEGSAAAAVSWSSNRRFMDVSWLRRSGRGPTRACGQILQRATRSGRDTARSPCAERGQPSTARSLRETRP